MSNMGERQERDGGKQTKNYDLKYVLIMRTNGVIHHSAQMYILRPVCRMRQAQQITGATVGVRKQKGPVCWN